MVAKIEDVQESIPDQETKDSKKIPILLSWTHDSRIKMPWPLGEGVKRIGDWSYNLDRLPKMDATECEISFNMEAVPKIVIHFPKCFIVLAKIASDASPNLLNTLA